MSVQHRVFAAAYDTLLKPLERMELAPRRARLLGGLQGTVVDVGAGTGVNLAHFRHAERVVLVEPDRFMRAKLAGRLGESSVPATVSDADAEHLPLADGEADAVVFTLVLCTVPDQRLALLEARRVLKPGGTLAVLEHGGSHRRGRFRFHGSQQVRGPGCCPGHTDHRGYGGSTALGSLSPGIRRTTPPAVAGNLPPVTAAGQNAAFAQRRKPRAPSTTAATAWLVARSCRSLG